MALQFNAVLRGKRPTKSDLQQLLSLDDHKLDRLSQLSQEFFGLLVHITKNRAPKLGLGNGPQDSRKDSIFKPIPFQECPMRLASKPDRIIYISGDHARFKNRFSGVSKGFPDNRVPIVPLFHAKHIRCLPISNFKS